MARPAINDDSLLAAIAELLLASPSLKPYTAIKRVLPHKVPRYEATLARLDRKFRARRRELLIEARRRFQSSAARASRTVLNIKDHPLVVEMKRKQALIESSAAFVGWKREQSTLKAALQHVETALGVLSKERGVLSKDR